MFNESQYCCSKQEAGGSGALHSRLLRKRIDHKAGFSGLHNGMMNEVEVPIQHRNKQTKNKIKKNGWSSHAWNAIKGYQMSRKIRIKFQVNTHKAPLWAKCA